MNAVKQQHQVQKADGRTRQLQGRQKVKVRCGSDGGSHGGPRPGTVVSRQDKETREHEETATATVNIVLDDNVTALQPGGSERGRARRTTVERGTRMPNPQCVIP